MMRFKLFTLPIFILYISCFSYSNASSKQPIPKSCRVVIIGAGIGSIYTAYRLAADTNTVPGNEICIFEALDRPGGRILTITNKIPSFEDFTVDLGAYRFGRTRHWMTRTIIEDLLGFDTQCYSDPFDLFPGTCPSPRNEVFSTRGRVFGFHPDGRNAADSFASYSNSLPYTIRKKFQWGPGRTLKSPRRTGTLLLGPNSVIREIRDRWEEFDSETDYKKAMRIADEILYKVVNGGTYKGIPYHEVSIWQAAIDQGYTAEELRLQLDDGGPVSPYTLHTHLERLATVSLREAAQAKADIGPIKGLVAPVTSRAGARRKIGMSVLFKGLLRDIERSGVKVFYGMRVGRVRRVPGTAGDMNVILESGQRIRTGTVFMNGGKTDLLALGLMSEPVNSASQATRQAFSRILPLPGTKTYCFWDDAWWVSKLNKTSGVFRLADETLFQGRYHDGDVKCTRGKCRGALLVSYASGSVNSGSPVSMIRSYNTQPYHPLVKTDALIYLIKGKMSAHQQLLYNDIHRQLRRTHESTFKAFGRNSFKDIKDARACIISDWKHFGHQVDIGAGRGDNDNKLFTKPVADLNISLVNEGWSEFRGWAEGSLITAERALFHVHGVKRPQWLDQTFHKSVIKRFNRG